MIHLRLKLFLVILLFHSCVNNHIVKEMEQFIGQQIMMSADWGVVYNGKDTVLTDFTKVPIKLIVWHDSLVFKHINGVITEIYFVTSI